jgi:hypothetical protein
LKSMIISASIMKAEEERMSVWLLYGLVISKKKFRQPFQQFHHSQKL